MSTPLTPAPAAAVDPAPDPVTGPVADTRRGPRLRALGALAAGAVLGLAWQPYGLWPLLLVGVPALTLLVRGRPPRRAFGLGYLFGLGLLAVSISWLRPNR